MKATKILTDSRDLLEVGRSILKCDLQFKSDNYFQDVSQVVRPTGRKLMLVSKGAVMLKIKRDDFFRYSTKQTLRQARRVVQELE